MPRNRRNDDARTPILQDVVDTHQYDDNELSQDSGSISCANICDPRSTFYRFFGLIFMCLVGFGKFYKYPRLIKKILPLDDPYNI